jgi:preprotein translocase subunit YajC
MNYFVFLAEGEATGVSQITPYIILGGGILLFIWFGMIRPQKRERERVKNMLDNLRKNDEVQTIGGVQGRVAAIKDDVVILKIDENSDVKMRVSKTAIAGIIKREGEEEEKEDAKKE